ncbi:hypothetical protein ABGN05_09135 [Aquibium sp. LZ166]|mgnify:CR=1 FL=1|uniref:Glycosyltransferase RgtA/B/C/D-like domain-containing protein n=1 Tax=Aquibium pacificus TaxID=3153579 RepID=A0ABV3SGD6_9HYPH
MHLSAREAIGTKQAIGLLVCLLAAVVNVVIATHTPMTLLADAFGDDATFIRAANTLLSGNYLGDYNSATLTKGPGYSIFLALGHLTGLAASLTIALFFLTALAAFSYMVARTYGAFLAGALVFVLGALHPVLPMERFVRDSIYPAQVLLMLAAFMAAFYVFRYRPFRFGILAGLALGWFWLTREEGPWVIPGLGLLAFGGFAVAWRDGRGFRQPAYASLAIAGGLLFCNLAYITANWAAYGSFVGNEFKEKNFSRALSLLQSVRDGDQIPYVPISKSTRRVVYGVSPTFALLEKGLDPTNRPIADHGCQFYKQTCGDYAGGWFIWHFRSAAADVGAFESPETASVFFGKMADEIEAACRADRLTCEPGFLSLMPQVHPEQVRMLPTKFLHASGFLMDPARLIHDRPSSGSLDLRNFALDVLNYPRIRSTAGPGRTLILRFWWTPKAEAWPAFTVMDAAGFPAIQTLEYQAAGGRPASGPVGLTITTRCDVKCTLLVEPGPGRERLTIPLADAFDEPKTYATAYGRLLLSVNDTLPDGQESTIVPRIRGMIAAAYVPLLWVLVPLGVATMAVAAPMSLFRRAHLECAVLAASLWGLVICRLALIALIEISAFPAMNKYYLGPAIILVIPAALCSIFALFVILRSHERFPLRRYLVRA